MDFVTDPLLYVNANLVEYSLRAARVVDRRADLLSTEAIIETAALDEYSFVRDACLQRRRSQVYDGDAPPQDE